MNNAKPLLYFIALLWLIEIINTLLGHRLNTWGILPRQLAGLPGILLWPLLHGGFFHLISNTVPLLILGYLVSLRGTKNFVHLTLFITLTSGLGVWLFARTAWHVGASGLIFGFFGYLLARGWFERSLKSAAIALLVAVVYGSLIFGVLPRGGQVSWEGHLFGLLAGVLAARYLSNTLKRG
ncbi:MAG: rhomboid family intramembrane serine protease [Gammaproteobacteria bacterium]|nr:rhomboid family intramembrane serine protease [Gammaproteobacteria bacterium]